MTNVTSNIGGFTLHQKAEQILLDLPEISETEKDFVVFDNCIKIKFAHPEGDFQLCVDVHLSDSADTVEAKFRALFAEHMESIEESYKDWECPSRTQGYAFDLLTC